MNWELVYSLANASVIPAWLLLMFAPQNKVTKLLVHSHLYASLLGLFYVYMLLTSIGGEGGMDTLQNLKLSFQREEVLILGWVHYLAFDLFVGAWITRDAATNQLQHMLVVPSLVLTLFIGPVGLLSYLLLRTIMLKKQIL
ncbi:MAG: hypothetical protein RL266_555 [Bacteroidota bacterium]|jgi:hypothetical protein